MKKNFSVMLIVLAATALVIIASVLFFQPRTAQREAEILSASATGELLIPITAQPQSKKEGITQLDVYRVNRDVQGAGYCLVYQIDAGEECEFQIAVGIDVSCTRVLGVTLLSDSITETNGTHVFWADTEYLDVYSGLIRKQLDTVQTLSVAPQATEKIHQAVYMAFETIDVRKESEDTYE